MKKGILLLFFLGLLVQIASAEIILNDFKGSYNKGEQLLISGILRNIAIEDGSLEFKLVCEDLEFNLPITINAKENEEFVVKTFMIPSAAEGECYVKVFLLFDETLLEEENSEIFTISNELKADGDFQINPVQVQLGKTLTLYGYITRDADLVTGSATIYFKSKDKVYYVEDVKVSEGKLEYSYNALDSKPGEYSIEILIEDNYGNKKLFEDVARFNILDEVHVFIEPIQKKLFPGSTVQLSGEVNTVLGEAIKEGVMQIILGDEIYNSNIKDGRFSYSLKLPEEIETGKHTIIFSFIEETGNWGSAERTIYIEAVPTEIKLNLVQESVKPGDLLEATAFLYDQAGDEIIDNIKVELTNPKGEPKYIGYTESGEKLSIDIPQYSVPGVWRLKASYLALEAVKEIIVEEVQNIEIELVNNTLYIKNVGNVEYDEPVSVDLDDGDFVFTKKVSLKPEETLTIDLTKEAPSGQYDIKVTGAAVTADQFDDVIIVGKNKKSLNFIYSALLIFVVASLAYLSIFKRRHFENIKIRSQRDVKYAQQKLKSLKAMKEKEPKKSLFSREQNISEFRNRILKDIKETEEKVKYRKEDSGKKKEDDLPSGMFNMFN